MNNFPHACCEIGLKLILKNKQGKILILKTSKDSSLKGFYDLPGGRIIKKEIELPFIKTLQREIREEIGPDVFYKINETPVAISRHEKLDKEKVLCIFFEGKFKKGKIVLSDEHIGYDWVRITKTNYKKYFIKGTREAMTHYLTGKLQ
jgi:8-oxo-dGTP pyrophosphatase MutT (NUDIX family)